MLAVPFATRHRCAALFSCFTDVFDLLWLLHYSSCLFVQVHVWGLQQALLERCSSVLYMDVCMLCVYAFMHVHVLVFKNVVSVIFFPQLCWLMVKSALLSQSEMCASRIKSTAECMAADYGLKRLWLYHDWFVKTWLIHRVDNVWRRAVSTQIAYSLITRISHGSQGSKHLWWWTFFRLRLKQWLVCAMTVELHSNLNFKYILILMSL